MKESRSTTIKGKTAMRFGIALVGLLWPLVGLSAEGGELPYRLAGILRTPDGVLALVEDSAGTQQWARTGEMVGEARVVAISADGVTLLLEDREFFLGLESGDNDKQTAAAKEPIPPPEYQSRRYAYGYLSSQLGSVQRIGDESEETATRRTLNRALRLPANARIIEVDRVPVDGPLQARAALEEKLSQGGAVKVQVKGVAGLKELYVTPEEP